MSFAINHMTVPSLRYDALIELAAKLGCIGIELRNDLAGKLFDGDTPQTVRNTLDRVDLRLLALAEVKAFNDWSDEKSVMASSLASVASSAGAEAIVLIPRNDGKGATHRIADLRIALQELKPILAHNQLIGLVEPLGFTQCSLRDKAEVIDTIEALGAGDVFKIVHDTFHHNLAGGGPVFAAHTGIVHVSGVVCSDISIEQMSDRHRVLVDADDRLGNLEQLDQLKAAGYDGPVSIEAFSPLVHGLNVPEAALGECLAYIQSHRM